MALTPIQQVRLLIQDSEPGLYFLADDEIEFLLERNADSVNATSIEAARLVLFKLAQRGDESVDLFSIKGSKQAEQYRIALQLYLRDSNLNPMLNNVGGYVGGVSKSDMEDNDANTDNNTANSGSTKFYATCTYSDPFKL